MTNLLGLTFGTVDLRSSNINYSLSVGLHQSYNNYVNSKTNGESTQCGFAYWAKQKNEIDETYGHHDIIGTVILSNPI